MTAVEFLFNSVYRGISYPELLGLIADAKIIEKQQEQDNSKYLEESLRKAFNAGTNFKELCFTYNKEYTGMKHPSFEKWLKIFKNK